MKYLELNNGKKIPMIGFGTFLVDGVNTNEAKKSVLCALKNGYRLIDTALLYRNEEQIGEAIQESGIKREDLFITTKYCPVANSTTFGFIEYVVSEQLKRLKTDYIDLYLIHWTLMKNTNAAIWRALEILHDKGILRSIGISNFWRHHIDDLLKTARIKPVMNQIHISPLYYPVKVIDYCRKQGIALTGYSAFKSGELENEVIKSLAKEKNVTPAQIILRWGIQKNICMIPKSVTPSRIAKNIDVFNFSLSDGEMERIKSQRYGRGQLWNPESIIFGGITW